MPRHLACPNGPADPLWLYWVWDGWCCGCKKVVDVRGKALLSKEDKWEWFCKNCWKVREDEKKLRWATELPVPGPDPDPDLE